ncbi:MAG: ABC transporter substrate-binding protein [Nitrososphaeraceae archaeon]
MAISDSWFAVVVLISILEQFWLSAVFFAAHYLVIAAGLLWYVKFLLSHRQLADEPAEIIVPNPKGNNNNPIKPKLQGGKAGGGAETKEENHKRIRNVALMALASIVIVGMAIVIYFSLFSFSSISFLFPFSSPSSELTIAPSPPAPASAFKQTVTLGALLPLTGVSSSLGESEEAALKIATRDINEYLFNTHSNIGIELVIQDTQTNPSVSLEKLKHLAAKGIKIVIGLPQAQN